MRLASTSELTELASGVDSFYLSGRSYLMPRLVEDLEANKAQACSTRTPVPFSLGEERFLVEGGSLNRYAFRLRHEHGLVGLTKSSRLPTVHIQPYATFIHGVGIERALGWFIGTLEMLLGEVEWTASRVDLFMDVQGWGLESDDRRHFVSRSRDLVTWEESDEFTGFRFGTGKSGTMARIYDKSRQAEQKGHDWWPLVWGESFQPGERVLRVEFQATRELLRETGIGEPVAALDELPGLWAYLTEQWLTLRTPSDDSNRSRWPIAPEWRRIQGASLRGNAIGLERARAGERAGSIRRLLPAARGYLASIGALCGASSLNDALHALGDEIRAQDEDERYSFTRQLADKRLVYGL